MATIYLNRVSTRGATDRGIDGQWVVQAMHGADPRVTARAAERWHRTPRRHRWPRARLLPCTAARAGRMKFNPWWSTSTRRCAEPEPVIANILPNYKYRSAQHTDTQMTKARTIDGKPRARFDRLRNRVDLVFLRRLARLVPSERERVYGVMLVAGAICGLAAVAFHLAIREAEHLLIDKALAASSPMWMVMTLVTPAMGGLVSGALLAYVVPDARGSGIPQVKVAYALEDGRLPLRQSVGKFVVGVLQIGSGASLGREGPTVQICVGISSIIGRLTALSRDNMRRLVPVGAAAGIAAAFNAPLAAVTFTMEEVVGDLDQTILAGVVVAAAVAAAIERSVLGGHPVLDVPSGYGLHHADSLVLYALMGVAAAVVSVAFTDSLLRLRARMGRAQRLPLWTRPALGGVVTGVLAIVAIRSVHANGMNGGGYAVLNELLHGGLAWNVMLLLCAMKLIATVSSYSTGGAGGIFAPSLFIGAALGGTFGVLDVNVLHHSRIEVGAFALVGMGAVFAGIIRAPITSVLIIFEMTGSYGLILPLMIAAMTCFLFARRWRPTPIYEALLEQDGTFLPHPSRPIPHVLDQLDVGRAMTSKPATIDETESVSFALDRIAAAPFSSFPVVDADARFVGLVSESKLRRSVADGGGEKPVGELAGRRIALTPESSLIDAIVLMDELDTRQLAVVDDDASRRVIGIVALSDVMRVQAQATRERDSNEVPPR
jgi:CIC family chloride channel protein